MMPLPVSDEVIEQLVEDMNSVSGDLQQTSVDLKDSVTILTKENEVKKNVVDEQKKRPYLTQTERKRFSLMSTIFETSFFKRLRDFRDQTLKEKAMTIAKAAFAPVSLAWKGGKKVWKSESIFAKIIKWLGIGFLIYQLWGDKLKAVWNDINPAIREPIENVANTIIGIFEELAGYIRKTIGDWFLNGGISNVLSEFFEKDVKPALGKIFELFYNSSDNKKDFEIKERWETLSELAQKSDLTQEQIKQTIFKMQLEHIAISPGMSSGYLYLQGGQDKQQQKSIETFNNSDLFNNSLKQLLSNKEFLDLLVKANQSNLISPKEGITQEKILQLIKKFKPELVKQEEILTSIKNLYKDETIYIDFEKVESFLNDNKQKQVQEDAKKQAEVTEKLNKELNPDAIRQATAAAATPFIQKMENIVNTLNGDVLTIDLTKALKESVTELTKSITSAVSESLTTIKTSVEEWVKNTRINLATTVQAKAAEITVTNEKGDNIQNATTEIEQNNITKQGNVEDIKATININNMNLPSLEKSIAAMNSKQQQQISLLEAQNKSISSVLESMTSFSRTATFYFNNIKNNKEKPTEPQPVFLLNNPATASGSIYNATTLKSTQAATAMAFINS